jgi:hypothetical protein
VATAGEQGFTALAILPNCKMVLAHLSLYAITQYNRLYLSLDLFCEKLPH